MKRRLNSYRFLIIFLLTIFCFSNSTAYSNNLLLVNADPKLYKAALLIEPTTGMILFEDRSRKPNIPASLVKMMVSLIVMEHLEKGKISLEDKVTVTRWASKIGGHQVYLKENEVFELYELMKAVVIGSANDAAVAVAEYIGGDQDGFVEMMNQRAEELKMKDTIYYNPHGLPPGRGQKENVTTAYDQALLARELLKYPQYLKWSSTIFDSFRNGTFELLNTNRTLLKQVPELDGMKTGYYQKAGFSVVATAKKNNTRLIAVVMGTKNKADRTRLAARLLKKGFSQFGLTKVLEKGDKLGNPLMVKNGLIESVELLVEKDVELFLSHKDAKQVKHLFSLPPFLTAPVQAGTVVGTVELQVNDRFLTKVNLLSARSIAAKTLWQRIKDFFKF